MSAEQIKNEKTKSAIRHILSLLGGILVALGLLTATDADLLVGSIEAIIGAVLTIVAVVAGWKNKEKLA